MTLTFNAIDVETANADRASICQIGIIQVRDGVIADHWQSLINPNAWFDPLNVSIHGLNANDVRNSPSFSDIRGELDRLSESILISHTSFDRVALERALKEHGLEPLRVTWLDSARIVRRAWPEQYGKSGWGLKDVATNLDISFNHHDALEDAKAVAEIVLRACTSTDTGIVDWLHLVAQPIFPSSDRTAVSKPEANPDGSLYGETILFTGELSVARTKAGELAAQAGCKVAYNASKKVTMLVVGTQDESKLRGYEKSSKHRKIETLINKGSNIEILSESDFFDLLGINRAEIAASKKSPPAMEKKPLVSSHTGIFPMRGKAYRSKLETQSRPVAGVRQPACFSSTTRTVASAKRGTPLHTAPLGERMLAKFRFLEVHVWITKYG